MEDRSDFKMVPVPCYYNPKVTAEISGNSFNIPLIARAQEPVKYPAGGDASFCKTIKEFSFMILVVVLEACAIPRNSSHY